MKNWPDSNPYSALLPYLDERAWLLPEILARRERRPGPAGRQEAAGRLELTAGPGPAAGARWTGTYFDRFLAPPPGWVLAEAAGFARGLAGPALLPRGCAVLVHDSRRVHRGSYCPGLPPDTGSRFTRRAREAIASYDRADSLPVLCVDRRARCSALVLVEWAPGWPGA